MRRYLGPCAAVLLLMGLGAGVFRTRPVDSGWRQWNPDTTALAAGLGGPGLTSPPSIFAALKVTGTLDFGSGTRDYLYACGAGLDQVCAAQDFRVGGAIAAGNLFMSSGTHISLEGTADIYFTYTDSTGTPGAATINKSAGKTAVAAGAGSVVITNSQATTTSQLLLTFISNDTTCIRLRYTCTTGSCTVSCNANATAATSFSWVMWQGQ